MRSPALVIAVTILGISGHAAGDADLADLDLGTRYIPVKDAHFIKKLSWVVPIDAQCLQGGNLEIGVISAKNRGLIVLCAGTEVGRLSEKKSEFLYRGFPDVLAGLSHSAAASESDPADPGTSILRHGRWDEGMDLQYGVDYAYSSILVRRNLARFKLAKNLGPVHLGAGVHHASFKGDLADSVQGADKAKSLGGSVAVGIPFVKYELKYAPHVLPEYFWLEQNLPRLYFSRDSAGDGAKFVKVFKGSGPGGIGHDLGLKFAYLRYNLIYQPDVYKQPVHRVYLQDFPLAFGSFSMGFYGTGDFFVPGFDLQLFPVAYRKVKLGSARFPMTWTPIDVQYHRLQSNQFLLSFRTGLSFDMLSAK